MRQERLPKASRGQDEWGREASCASSRSIRLCKKLEKLSLTSPPLTSSFPYTTPCRISCTQHFTHTHNTQHLEPQWYDPNHEAGAVAAAAVGADAAEAVEEAGAVEREEAEEGDVGMIVIGRREGMIRQRSS